MKVELVQSTVGDPVTRQFSIAAVVNDTVAIDAGTIGLLWPMERQLRIRHVFLSHSHLDHVASLPLFLDNVYDPRSECPTVYSCPATAECLRRDVFNDRLWPDFIRLSEEETPFLKLETLRPETAVKLPGLTVTPVPLNHIVPTMSFLIQDDTTAVAIVFDTSPTERIWELLGTVANLRAVFLEASFPNSHRWLAEKSGHLCPEQFEQELQKLSSAVPVIACHLKPRFFDEIAEELRAILRDNLTIGVPGREYVF